MLTAMLQEIAERGAANVSVAHVVARSGVSRRTFYEIFADREDCFLAAFDDALGGVAAIVVSAYEESGSWRAKMRRGLTALLECLDNDPGTARMLIVESLAAGPKALERRQRVLAQVVLAVEQGRNEGRGDPPPLAGDGVVGGALSVLHARLVEDRTEGLLDLLNPLMGMIVLPYLGPASARKEMGRRTPQGLTRRTVPRRDPLQRLEMRLTYRTVCVLRAVAANPDASNRVVADEAGISDQGQISKLLSRLQRLELIENTGAGSVRGAPNAWMLTVKGREVQDAIASQTARS
jgi:AcrR family transcriptional regulator